LQAVVDTLIIIPNQNLFRLANERTTFTEAFSLADDVLYQGVKGVTDLMVRPGMINLDFADVRAVMDEMGKAMMGTGEASGEDRARQAAEKAIANPLLDEISLNGARGVLINITGGSDLTLYELDEAANLIRDKVDPDANIIVGSTLDDTMEGAIRVSVVATGIEAAHDAQSLDVQRRRLAEPLAAHALPFETEQDAVHEPDYGYDVAAQEEPAYEAQAEPYSEPQVEPRYEPQYEARAEERPEYRPEYRPEFRAEPRQQAYAPQHAPDPRQQQAYAPAAEAPAQDEFDLDDVLGEQAEAPRPTVVLSARRQPPAAPQSAHQPAPQPAAYRPVDEAASFTAPSRQRSTGQPSPETLQRLRNAVLKQPEQGAPRQEQSHQPRYESAQEPNHEPAHDPRQEQRHQPRQQAPQHAPQPDHGQERSRFGGLGGLIHRMAGTGAGTGTEAPAQATRQQPPVQSYDDEPQHRASQERIEIPAFLRRQAN